MEFIEDQPGRGAPGKFAHPKLPPPLKYHFPPPQPSLPSRTEHANPKRKREQEGKDVMETRRSRLTHEEEAQTWLPTPMLSGEPLRDDASIRDFNGGIGCHVASTLEQALLLPKDMFEL